MDLLKQSYLICEVEVEPDDNDKTERSCFVIREEFIDETKESPATKKIGESTQRIDFEAAAEEIDGTFQLNDWHRDTKNEANTHPQYFRVCYVRKKSKREQQKPVEDNKDEAIGKRTRSRSNLLNSVPKETLIESAKPLNLKNSQLPLKCGICCKIIGSKSLLSQHLLQHRIGNKYVCPICGKMLISLTFMIYHRASHSSAGRKQNKYDH